MLTSAIRDIRTKAGMSTEEALKELQISYSMLNKIERGDRLPSTDLIAKMSRLYKCTTDDIYKALKKIS